MEADKEFRYWQQRLVSWSATVDEHGDVVVTGPERIEDVTDSGLWGEMPEELRDDWQVMN